MAGVDRDVMFRTRKGIKGALYNPEAAYSVALGPSPNYFTQAELRMNFAGELMSAPYKRIVILHIAVIAGGFGISALGEPLVLLLALVVLKIVVDIALHRREHSGAATL